VPQPWRSGRWDGRFELAAFAPTGDLAVRFVGASGVAALRARGLVPHAIDLAALRTSPGVWLGDTLLAAPALAPPALARSGTNVDSATASRYAAELASMTCRFSPFTGNLERGFPVSLEAG
jgi:hypothetical protein